MTLTAQNGRLSEFDRAAGNGNGAGAARGAMRESPATPTQSALWFIHQMDPAGSAYNIPLAFDLVGPLDVAALRSALETLVARHDILRSVYAERGDELVLRTFHALTPDAFFEQHTWPGGNGAGKDIRDAMRALAAEEAARPFVLGSDAPLRARLWSFERDRHLLTLVFHHIAVDQPAIGTFVNQLAALYDARRGGTSSADTSSTGSSRFTDFARQRAGRARAQRDEHDGLTSWTARLDGFSGVLNLPTIKDGAGTRAEAGASGDVHRFSVPHEVADAVRAFADARTLPEHAVYLAAFHALLHQHSGQDDIIVGVPMSDRGDDVGLQDVVGCFLNTLPIAVRVDAAQGFGALATSTHEALCHADAHRAVPFESIVEAVRPRREPGLNPIYQVGFAFEDALLPPGFDGIRCDNIEVHSGGAMYDLHLCLANAARAGGPGRMRGTLWYDTGRFDADFARRLMDRYVHLIAALLARPDAPLEEFPIATPQELAELTTWHGVERDWPSAATTLGMFAEQARGHPHDIAVIAHSGGMTYAELLMRARQLSAMLTARGIQRGDLVGVCMTRDLGMIIAVLGVMGAGAAYVPLDPDYPNDRLAYIAREARLRVLVAEPGLADFDQPQGCEPILLDADGSGVPEVHAAREPARHAPGTAGSDPGPDDIMYVIFTSGSTGRPKGVAVPHSCVSNFLHAVAQAPGFCATDRLLAVTTLSFDIAVLELFLPLTMGGTVVLADSEQTHDGDALAELIDEHDVNVMQATPSTWRMLIEAGWEGVKGDAGGGTPGTFRALCGGEALPPALASAISARVTELWNLYGPTETTVWSMRERVRPGSPITIGRPLENTTCHVLSPSRQLLPAGIPGELYIGGAGVTAGYLHRPDLTIDRFIANPFGTKEGRLYRTGDKVVRLGDGRLLYLGRLDNQVKVNGHRVELGEIESVLEELPSVRQAAAMVSAGEDGDARLVAYVVAADGEPVFGSEIRRALRDRLPDYMVPSMVLPLDALPLTPNGKVDRKALPDPLAGRRDVEFVGPRTEAERTVASVWSELLGVERVGVMDNFFEIGGHSLLAIRATARLGDRVGVRPDPRAMFFQTLEQVAASLQGAADGGRPMQATAP
ncbi:MAG TPA: amino acid adenylation domain-containing protein [Gemmatimonadaceae bacterium]|nr:amino acid adenylation domain-containing protein [Gemmatimonadaceae bacterium]